VLAELGKFDGAAVVFSRRSRVRDLGSMLKLVRMSFSNGNSGSQHNQIKDPCGGSCIAPDVN
jgi:hypothetical protein